MSLLEQYFLEPARVLSLDGGGVRGLSALAILQTIMDHLGDQERPQKELSGRAITLT